MSIELEKQFGELLGQFIMFDFDTYLKYLDKAEEDGKIPEYMKDVTIKIKSVAIKMHKTQKECKDEAVDALSSLMKVMAENMDDILKDMKTT